MYVAWKLIFSEKRNIGIRIREKKMPAFTLKISDVKVHLKQQGRNVDYSKRKSEKKKTGFWTRNLSSLLSKNMRNNTSQYRAHRKRMGNNPQDFPVSKM